MDDASSQPTISAQDQAMQGMRLAKSTAELERWYNVARSVATTEQWPEFEQAYVDALEHLSVCAS
jgi:hypothetical protein